MELLDSKTKRTAVIIKEVNCFVRFVFISVIWLGVKWL